MPVVFYPTASPQIPKFLTAVHWPNNPHPSPHLLSTHRSQRLLMLVVLRPTASPRVLPRRFLYKIFHSKSVHIRHSVFSAWTSCARPAPALLVVHLLCLGVKLAVPVRGLFKLATPVSSFLASLCNPSLRSHLPPFHAFICKPVLPFPPRSCGQVIESRIGHRCRSPDFSHTCLSLLRRLAHLSC